MPDRGRALTEKEVIELEHDYVRRRRKSTGDSGDDAGDTALEDTLVGLALSGGGIRSATFGLGVLEGLKEYGLLKQVDFLSTVSGGGYIGGWLSANCKRAADRANESRKKSQQQVQSRQSIDEQKACDPWLLPETRWEDSIAHLRRYSNYLSPKVGLFSADTWSMATIWLRNSLLVQATVIFAIAAVLLIPRFSFELFNLWHGQWRWLTVALFFCAVACIVVNLSLLSRPDPAPIRRKYWHTGTAAAILLSTGLAIGLARYWDLNPFIYEERFGWDFYGSFAVAILAAIGGCASFWCVILLSKYGGELNSNYYGYSQVQVQCAIVVPLLLTAFFISAVLWAYIAEFSTPASLDYPRSYGDFLTQQWRSWPFPLQIALISLWLFSFGSISWRTVDKLKWSRILIAILAPLPAVAVFYLAVCAILLLLQHWASDIARANSLALIYAPTLVLFSYALSIIVLIGMMGRYARESVREWWSRLGAWLGIYGVAWLVVSFVALQAPKIAATIAQNHHVWSSSLGGILTTIGGLLAARSGATGNSSSSGKKSWGATLLGVLVAIGPFVYILGLLILVSTALHLILLTWQDNVLWGNLAVDHWQYLRDQHLWQVLAVLLVVVIIAVVLGLRVDINVFSLNTFYRNRLNRCYLGAANFLPCERNPQNFTALDDNDDFPIGELAEHPVGPYHIVNCALNLGGSKDLALHTRHSASFIISPKATGSGYIRKDSVGNESPVGYRKTGEYGGKQEYPNLGQAISISGAAASPNMGYHTSPTASFLLTMFNARLGWWFPNPDRPSRRPSPLFSLKYLIYELMGIADERSSFLSVSDGGHFENLGVYELIRRECKIIIVSDAECDPQLQCEGLARLIRMCEVDFNTRIDIDVGAIRLAPGSSWSRARCAIGDIEYRNSKKAGILIYIKASMTGHEDTAIMQYKATHPDFPHESTGNQFYSEDQFESYRNLGREIALQVFKSLKDEKLTYQMVAWVLSAIWSPNLLTTTHFTSHSKILMELWRYLGSIPDLKLLEDVDQNKLATWSGDVLPENFRSLYYACLQIIRLMENVYFDLDLEKTWDHIDNRGWKDNFLKWSSLPAVQKTWNMSASSFGLRFQHFWNQNLVHRMAGEGAA